VIEELGCEWILVRTVLGRFRGSRLSGFLVYEPSFELYQFSFYTHMAGYNRKTMYNHEDDNDETTRSLSLPPLSPVWVYMQHIIAFSFYTNHEP
jgi:hypothetical protein